MKLKYKYACRVLVVCVINFIIAIVLKHNFGGKDGVVLKQAISRKIAHVNDTLTSGFRVRRDSTWFDLTQKEQSVIEGIDCLKLCQGNPLEIKKAENRRATIKPSSYRIPDVKYIHITSNCTYFVRDRGYILHTHVASRSYPIAFTILLHRDVYQFERMLRSLYRPQNQYCIHLDAKATDQVEDAIYSIARCFENVFIASRREYVIYAGISRLRADVNCMSDHLIKGDKWKYLINFASSEFPIRSNSEMITILKLFNGTNDIHMTEKYSALDKIRYTFVMTYNFTTKQMFMRKTAQRKKPPPFNLTITKGNAYNIFSREFVKFVFENEKARHFLHWNIDTFSPDEHYWSTLNNLRSNPQLKTPGGFKGPPDRKPYTAKFIQWQNVGVCRGKYVHKVCILGVGDLQTVWKSPHFSANKFDVDYDPVAYTCMEQMLRSKDTKRAPLRYDYYRRVHSRAKGSLD